MLDAVTTGVMPRVAAAAPPASSRAFSAAPGRGRACTATRYDAPAGTVAVRSITVPSSDPRARSPEQTGRPASK
jgi:hypothetical protein